MLHGLFCVSLYAIGLFTGLWVGYRRQHHANPLWFDSPTVVESSDESDEKPLEERFKF